MIHLLSNQVPCQSPNKEPHKETSLNGSLRLLWRSAAWAIMSVVPLSLINAQGTLPPIWSQAGAVQQLAGRLWSELDGITTSLNRVAMLAPIDSWSGWNQADMDNFWTQNNLGNNGSPVILDFFSNIPNKRLPLFFYDDVLCRQPTEIQGRYINALVSKYHRMAQNLLSLWSSPEKVSEIIRTLTVRLDSINKTLAMLKDNQSKYTLYIDQQRNDVRKQSDYQNIAQSLKPASIVDIDAENGIKALLQRDSDITSVWLDKSAITNPLYTTLRWIAPCHSSRGHPNAFINFHLLVVFQLFLDRGLGLSPSVAHRQSPLLNPSNVLVWAPELKDYFTSIKQSLEKMIKNVNFLQPLIVKHCHMLLSMKPDTSTPFPTGS